jgi:hypothetical protein
MALQGMRVGMYYNNTMNGVLPCMHAYMYVHVGLVHVQLCLHGDSCIVLTTNPQDNSSMTLFGITSVTIN